GGNRRVGRTGPEPDVCSGESGKLGAVRSNHKRARTRKEGRAMRNLIKNLVSDESGQDLAEYAIALAVIAVGVGAVVVGLGTDVMGVWTAARARVQSAT